jgi:hypothetical protein
MEERIAALTATDVASLMGFNYKDINFGESGEVREMLNAELVEKFENEEIDEIELLIIESGN